MVTEITNNTDKDIIFYIPNVNTFVNGGGASNPPTMVVSEAKSVIYSRSVTGNSALEKYLTDNGCTLKRVRRSYIVIVAGQSNAVGYDESPLKPDDVKPIPFAYYEGLYPTTRSAYSSAGQVPIRAPYVDCFQNMKSAVNSAGNVTKGIHRYIAEKLIKFVPDDYELEIWGYACGGSGVKTGNAGTVSGSNLPDSSTLWGDTGALTLAAGKRIGLHFKTIQPQSKLMAMVWCLGEYDGMSNVSATDYADGFNATVTKLVELGGLTDDKYVNPSYQLGTKSADGKKYPLWIVYPGPQKYWNEQGTFKDIINWQKENFSNFVDLPVDLPTNDANSTGNQLESWKGWGGYGFTSSALASHYGDCLNFIGHKVGKQIINNLSSVNINRTVQYIKQKLFDVETFINVKFKVKDTQDGDIEFIINGTGNPNRNVTPSGYYWDGSSSSPLKLINQPVNFIVKDGYLKVVVKGVENFMYTSSTKAEDKKVKATGIIRLS